MRSGARKSPLICQSFPRLAAALYLFVAIRGVLIVGGEGRFSVRALTRG